MVRHDVQQQMTTIIKTMKLSSILLLATGLAACAETEERISKQFTVQPGGTLVVDVDFGSLDVKTHDTGEVVVDVVRKITRPTKAEEEEFLADRPVTFTPDGNTLTIESHAATRNKGPSTGKQRTEGKYTITVPAKFSAQLKTAGGAIAVSDLAGEVKAGTTGGGLKFARVHGPLDGKTAAGAIQVVDCEGEQQVKTSGGGIEVSGGSGSFDGKTSGGLVLVKNFKGSVQVKSTGGGITVENVAGKVDGKTAGGAIAARFASPPSDEVSLATSGGGVTLQVAENAAFDLDAATAGGNVSSELSVDSGDDGKKPMRNRLKGPVNGGGKPVVLRSGGGSIQVRKL
jgi:hypothetical protein